MELSLKRIKCEIRLGKPNRPMSTGPCPQAHVHKPKEGRAYPLCGPLTERRPRLAHHVSENLLYKDEACSARMRLALQGWSLLYKDEACSIRMRLALQGWDLLHKERRQDLTTIKRPQHPHKKVRVTNSSLAL